MSRTPSSLKSLVMTHVAFTATRHWDMVGERLVAKALGKLDPATDLIITGGCVGGDASIARQAWKEGFEVHTILPANRAQVDPHWHNWAATHEECPPGSSYRDRNTALVHAAHRLIAFPDREEERDLRSGTWMTVRIARNMRKPVELHLLHPRGWQR